MGDDSYPAWGDATFVIISEGITNIGSGVFSGFSGLTSVTIPNSVTSIGAEAFWGCSGLTSVDIPDSVTSIGHDAFSGTSWYNNLPDGVVYAGKILYGYKGTITSVVVKEGTVSIGNNAFQNSGLTSITIPNSVTSIGDAAFYGCSSLAGVKLTGNTPMELADTSAAFQYFTATLLVPTGALAAYQNADIWKNFGTIIEYIDVIDVELNKSTSALSVDQTDTLTATVSPADATNKAVTWSSSNTSIATVSANGLVTALAAGTDTITATTADGDKTAICVVTVDKINQTIVWDSIPSKTYSDADFNLPSTTDKSLIISYVSSNTTVATVSSDRVTITGVGQTNITATQAGNVKYNAAAPVTHTLTVSKANQTIASGDISKTYGDADVYLPLTTNKGLTISYESSNATVATVSDHRVTITGVGQTEITATQAGDTNYNAAAPVTRTLTVSKANQTIGALGAISKTYGDADFELPPTTDKGLPIAYSSGNDSVATVTDNQVHIIGAGTAQITATQAAGNANYNPATAVTCTLTVGKANQTIVLSNISKTFGDADFDLPDTTNRGLPIAYASGDELVATVIDNHVHIVGTGTAQITATQAGDANCNAAAPVTRYLTVNSNSSAITFDTLPAKKYGDAPFALVATSTLSGPITFISSDDDILSISDTTATIHKAGSVSITASQADGAATFTRALDIDKTTVTITANDTSMFYGDDKPTSFTCRYSGFVNGETEAVLDSFPTFVCNYNGGNVGDYVIKPNLIQSDGNYKFAFQNGKLTVEKATQTFAFWENDTTVTYGEVLYLVLPNTDKGRSITYISDNQNVARISSNIVFINKAGVARITATVASNANYFDVAPVTRTLTVGKIEQTFDFWENDTMVTYAEASYLDLPDRTDKGWPITYTGSNEAVASISDSRVAIKKVGTVRITATVAGNENFTTVAPVTRTLTVNKANGGVIAFWENDTTVTYGEVPNLNLPSTTDKGLPITYTSDNVAVASVSGSLVSIKKVGTAHITATVADTTNYNVAKVIRTLTVDSVAVTSVTLSKTTATLGIGTTQQLIATAAPIRATNKTVTWSSSNTSIVTVSASGVVTAKAAGTATITATTADGGKTATCVVTATSVAVVAITLSNTIATLTIGTTQQLTATVAPTNATNKTITWSSSDTSIATVSATSGAVTAKAAGTATITATAADGGGETATCAVTVNPVAVIAVTLSNTTATLTIGTTQQLTATVAPLNATNKTVMWGSSDTSIATVSATSGVVTAKAAGTATITATAADGSGTTATCMVTVNERNVSVTDITIDATNIELIVGATQQLTATVQPTNATNQTVSWRSNFTNIATVSATGEITAKTPGTAIIMATAADGGKTKSCVVKVTAPVPTYTMTFDSQNGSAVSPQTNIVSGTKATPPSTAPTLEGYTFGGWYKEATCTNVWIFANNVVTSNTTLYAKWTAESTAIETITDKLQLYPSPTADMVHIKNANGAEVQVYTQTGELLQSTTESPIDLSGYPSGVYLLKVGNETLKVVKK
ncbi:endoglucanase [Candidatus Symbiothrix dinenymphae]|nr:endoglucanase [Candidatus Symbiothrix dinenymphae]